MFRGTICVSLLMDSDETLNVDSEQSKACFFSLKVPLLW